MDGPKETVQDDPMLAETVKLSGGEVLIILLVLLGMLAVVLAVVVLGCVWAWKAGRGSETAKVLWIVCASLEALALLSAAPSALFGRSFAAVFPAGALGAQLALYFGAKGRR